jgi:sulfatase modifying factor 1
MVSGAARLEDCGIGMGRVTATCRAVGVLLLNGCATIFGLEEGVPAEGSGGGPASSASASSSTTSASSTSSTGGGPGSGGGASSCGEAPGEAAAMVPQQRSDGACFWIDVTEVTAAAYDAFVDGAGDPDQAAPCDDNATFELDETCVDGLGSTPGGTDPVVCVDWCDASAYCASHGKHLCRGDFLALTDPASSEWYAACSDDGRSLYPYGGNYVEQACNGGCSSECTATTAGSLDSCQAACGARDLSGNVTEWVDECNGDECLVRGGGANDGPSALSCEGGVAVPRLTADSLRGFRCCGDPMAG